MPNNNNNNSMMTIKLIAALLLTLHYTTTNNSNSNSQVVLFVSGVVQNGPLQRRIPISSCSSLLPIDTSTSAPTPKKRRASASSRDLFQRDAAATNTGSGSGSEPPGGFPLPEKIPRLSDLMMMKDHNDVNDKKTVGGGQPVEESNKPTKTKSKSAKGSAGVAKKKRRRRSSDATRDTMAWRAGFHASVRTQGHIKKAFSSQCRTPNEKAKKVLQALLSTSPHQCNAANIVCALTFSAKARGTQRMQPDEELRSLLFQTLDVLHELVFDNVLTTRQLCNACWAIAKHYDRDSYILPLSPKAVALSSETAIGQAETWDMLKGSQNRNNEGRRERVDETVDEIAKQLTIILEESDDDTGDSSIPFQAKIGEICMACWAYGKLRHRNTPPGWAIPPQLGRLPNAKREAKKLAVTSTNVITFEQWGSFGDKKKVKKGDKRHFWASEETTGKFFDAIAASLSRSPESFSVEKNLKNDDESTKRFRTCLDECSWSELANVGWAFAAHGSCKSVQSEMLLLGLAREARRRLDIGGKATEKMLVRDIAQLLWALGTLQSDNFRLADDLVYLVEALSSHLRLGTRSTSFGRGRPFRKWSCADLVQVSISLAHARIDELPLLRAIFQECNYRLTEVFHEELSDFGERRSFRSWEVSVLLWAQARLYLSEPEGLEFEEFASEAPKLIMKALEQRGQSLQSMGVGPQEQANIVWSLTVLEQHQSPEAVKLIDRIFQEAAEVCKEQGTIQLEHAHQLWQAYFLLEDESPEAIAHVPSWFSRYLEDKWSLEKSRGKMSSARHRALSQALNFMGVDHYNEHDEDIDVAIVLKGNAAWTHETETSEAEGDRVSVAVEFDGPNHFTREAENPKSKRPKRPRALGHTVLKYRLLKKQGWTVVRVPYYEFDKIPFWASMERQRYLQRKLKTHANIQFSQSDVSEYKTLKPNRKSRFD